jgi:peptide/nickel transport system substrate-binding protein
MGNITRREFIRLSALTAVGVAASACARPTPEVVEKEVTKIVKETVLAPGTPTVVEKEVTKVVQQEVTKEVVVTATPSADLEDPIVAGMVQNGQLPPLNERLPVNPLVLDQAPGEVGHYGGRDLILAWPNVFWDETVFTISRDSKSTLPNVAESWEAATDGLSFTVHMRKGLKWSDGQPLTADDVVFWYEALVLNDTLTPVKPVSWTFGGQLMQVVKQDDYTVQLQFAAPFYYAVSKLDGHAFGGGEGRGADAGFYLPAHWLKQYHIDYNKDADKLAVDAGFKAWNELFSKWAVFGLFVPAPAGQGAYPTVQPWNTTKEDATTGYDYDRNPYYFKVDAAGAQLPYIGHVHAITWGSNNQTRVLQLTTGQVDFEQWDVYIGDYPVLFQNQDKGGYDLWLAKDVWPAYSGYAFNETYEKDPELAKLLADVRFRQALSLAMNREEIKESACLGKGTVQQSTCDNAASFYKKEWETAFAAYDVAGANKLLDEIGLTERDSEGFRLNLAGDKLSVVVECADDVAYWVATTELVKAYWQAVGIRTIMTSENRDLEWNHLSANETQVFTWCVDGQVEPLLLQNNANWLLMDWWAPLWNLWNTSKGEQGEEPPADVKRIIDLCTQIPSTPPDKIGAVMTELFDAQAANLYVIGTVGYVGKPSIANRKLGNIDKECYGNSWDLHGSHNFLVERFYWKE